MNLEFACRVEQGRRPYNDDRALFCGHVVSSDSDYTLAEMPEMAAVCDGCGGHAGGNVAAQLVLETLAQYHCTELQDEAALRVALDSAEKRIMEEKQRSSQLHKMCTTVAGCIFCTDKTILFHSGDSRVYRYDGRGIARMTIDHSLVQEFVDMGQITEAEIRTHPNRNIIRRAMGLGGLPPEIYICGNAIEPGEIYLICSDGFWESMTDQEIQKLLDREQSLTEKVNTLVEAALEAGSDDNISIVLCKCHAPTERKRIQRLILD